MAYRLLLPRFGMAMQAAKIIEWKKEVGDYIGKEEAVLAVENEKLTTEIVSMEAGVLLKKVAQVGKTYSVGDLLAYIGKEGEAVDNDVTAQDKEMAATSAAKASVAGGSKKPDRAAASPLAKKIAAELNLDYTIIQGTGPGGRIVKDDILNYSRSQKLTAAAVSSEGAYTVVQYSGMRKAIGDKMSVARATIPMVTHHVKADTSELMRIRARLNDGIEDKELRFSVNDMMLKLAAVALARMPELNATLEENEIHMHSRVDLGMATSIENGLIVPVIRGADSKSLADISREAKAFAAAARTNRLTSDDVTGGTFTVSNLGGYDSVDFFTPIINPPQVAVLGIGRTADEAVPVCGEIEIRLMTGLSLTYDHRVIDGALAAEFIKLLLALLANPLQALLR